MSDGAGHDKENSQSLTCACASLPFSDLHKIKKSNNNNNSSAMGIINLVLYTTKQRLRDVKQPYRGHPGGT